MRQNGVQTLAVDGVASVAPVSTETVYSDKFDLTNVVKIGLELTAAGTTPDVLVSLVVSQSDDDDYAVETGYANIINLVAAALYRKTIYDSSIPAARWGKLIFTGQGANGANVAVTGNINLIRDID